MIELKQVSKSFGDIRAVRNVSAEVRDGEVFGLIGTHGAGKSTLLRMMAGVLQADAGEITVDGAPVYENPEVKQKICFLADTVYYYQNATPDDMARVYGIAYPNFDRGRFNELLGVLSLDPRRKIRTFSKGMQKQLTVVLGISTNVQYLFCDETFDGLDPVMRQAVKGLFATEMLDRGLVPVIASHNLRELEDICDHVGLLHEGGVLLSESLEDMKFHMQKVQFVLEDPAKVEELLRELDVVSRDARGSMTTIIARGTRTEIMERIRNREPVFAEALPLTLEEIFIFETEVAGYDLKHIIS